MGDGFVDALAEGPASGLSATWMRSRANADEGIRTPNVGRFAVTSFASSESFGLGRRIVSGPGQKRDMSGSYIAGIFVFELPFGFNSRFTISIESTCTIKGLSDGRFLALYIPCTEPLLVASAPRPYTVSVGNPTGISLVRRASAASRTAADSGVSLAFSSAHHCAIVLLCSRGLLRRRTGRIRVCRSVIVDRVRWARHKVRRSEENSVAVL